MDVTLDQQRLPLRLPESPSLGVLVDLVRRRVALQHRIVTRIELDGHALNPAALVAAQFLPVKTRSVAFTSRLRSEMAEDLINRLFPLIEYLAARHEAAAAAFSADKPEQARETITFALPAWEQIDVAFTSAARLLHINLHALSVGSESAARVLGSFRRKLLELAQALKSETPSALADAAEDAFREPVRNWKALLEAALFVAQSASVLSPAEQFA